VAVGSTGGVQLLLGQDLHKSRPPSRAQAPAGEAPPQQCGDEPPPEAQQQQLQELQQQAHHSSPRAPAAAAAASTASSTADLAVAEQSSLSGQSGPAELPDEQGSQWQAASSLGCSSSMLGSALGNHDEQWVEPPQASAAAAAAAGARASSTRGSSRSSSSRLPHRVRLRARRVGKPSHGTGSCTIIASARVDGTKLVSAKAAPGSPGSPDGGQQWQGSQVLLLHPAAHQQQQNGGGQQPVQLVITAPPEALHTVILPAIR
jgi:hypothetical protein